MNDKDRELLTSLKINVEYIKEKVDSLDSRVAIQNGRVTTNEKSLQHIRDTINEKTIENQIHKAIEKHESAKLKKFAIIIGLVATIASLAGSIIAALI